MCTYISLHNTCHLPIALPSYSIPFFVFTVFLLLCGIQTMVYLVAGGADDQFRGQLGRYNLVCRLSVRVCVRRCRVSVCVCAEVVCHWVCVCRGSVWVYSGLVSYSGVISYSGLVSCGCCIQVLYLAGVVYKSCILRVLYTSLVSCAPRRCGVCLQR